MLFMGTFFSQCIMLLQKIKTKKNKNKKMKMKIENESQYSKCIHHLSFRN